MSLPTHLDAVAGCEASACCGEQRSSSQEIDNNTKIIIPCGLLITSYICAMESSQPYTRPDLSICQQICPAPSSSRIHVDVQLLHVDIQLMRAAVLHGRPPLACLLACKR
jgi:hypothetical protein